MFGYYINLKRLVAVAFLVHLYLKIKDYPPKALELKGIDQHDYDCDYYGHISDEGEGGLYQWSYFYEQRVAATQQLQN